MKENKLSDIQHYKMLNESVPHIICRLSVPTVINQLITVVYNTADTFFVSQISTSAAAAVGVVFSLMSIIQAFGFGIGMGCGSLISRKLGEQKNDEADKYANSAVFAALILGMFLQIMGLLFLKPLMRIIGSTDTILPYSCSYGGIILFNAPIMCMTFVLNNILRSEGAVVFSMIGMSTGGILNVFLDPLFIYNFNMGISGAALATVISQCISFAILFNVFFRKKTIVELKLNGFSRNLSDYAQIFKNGFPTICRQGLASFASACLNIQAAAYGDAVIAAITIANKIYLLVRNIVIGIGQGYQPVAGYSYGAGSKKRVKKLFWFSNLLGTIVCCVAAVLIFIYAKPIIAWFRNDAQVIDIGVPALYAACAVMPFMAYSTYVNQTYQCLGFSKGATFLASCRQGIFFLPLIFILPSIIGVTGIQIVQPAADLCTFIVSIPFQISFFRKNLE